MAATSRRNSSEHSNVIFERTSHKEHFCTFSYLQFRLGSEERGQYKEGKVKSQRKTLPLCCKTQHQVGSFNWIRNQSTSSFSTTLPIFWEKKTTILLFSPNFSNDGCTCIQQRFLEFEIYIESNAVCS